ncbi:hypothetical protein FHX42_001269 [Saccharopolyspora lacisalsi]|uniref:DUF2188 domain-containing protein n=1 Tax=Halosaccharopolyspora lacisalsi TaxID=1000566 RepID=A0A839DSK6_9PSEU|nr:hypothetical protein [Halosaccharopolyspora lacisalsi]MBA8823940.1 hypothetical protein [Halosaccharopolyspora lacisalsi]
MAQVLHVAAHPVRGWQITTANGQYAAFVDGDEAHEAIGHAQRLVGPDGRVIVDEDDEY